MEETVQDNSPMTMTPTANVSRQKPLVIVVAGGSGSGKTTLVQKIMTQVASPRVGCLVHDSYYKDWPELEFESRKKMNYDHPDSLENDLLVQHLQDLMAWKAIDMPQYDFASHARKKETTPFEPCDVIILEGILTLQDERIREIADLKIFVETDADIRFMRRLTRDVEERGRSVDGVITQYLTTVRPMHEKFVQPCALAADIIVPAYGCNRVAASLIVNKIKSHLNEVDSAAAQQPDGESKRLTSLSSGKLTPFTTAETERVWHEVPSRLPRL